MTEYRDQAILRRCSASGEALRGSGNRRGFQLVELAITLAILGILSSLGWRTVGRQLALAKAAEATTNLSGIRKGVLTSADKDWTKYQILDLGGQTTNSSGSSAATTTTGSSSSNGNGKGKGNSSGATVTHGVTAQLCGAAEAVPASLTQVRRKKYQSRPRDWAQGDRFNGWPCLRFEVRGPQYFQYGYELGGPKVSVTLPHGGTPPGLTQDQTWTAWARGDLDGDDVYSWYFLTGAIVDGRTWAAPGLGIQDEGE